MVQRKKTASDADKTDSKKSAADSTFLAQDLGHALDDEGEPAGIDFRALRSDPEIRQLAMSVWRQFQTSKNVERQSKKMESEGLTFGDLWAPGMTTKLTTSSTPEEIDRYRKQLLFRATLLEAVLTETVSELEGIERAIMGEGPSDEATKS